MPGLIFLAHDFSLGGKSEPLSVLLASPAVQDSAREDHIFLTPSRIMICELPNWRVVSGWENSSQRAEWNISMDEVSTNYFSDSWEACLQTAGDTSSEDIPSKMCKNLAQLCGMEESTQTRALSTALGTANKRLQYLLALKN